MQQKQQKIQSRLLQKAGEKANRSAEWMILGVPEVDHRSELFLKGLTCKNSFHRTLAVAIAIATSLRKTAMFDLECCAFPLSALTQRDDSHLQSLRVCRGADSFKSEDCSYAQQGLVVLNRLIPVVLLSFRR